MSENDGIDDALRGAVGGAMRTVITAAGHAGQRIAQQIATRAQERARLSEQQAREAQARYDAQRHAARAQVSVVHRDDWWDRATPEGLGKVWQTASAWRGFDADVAAAAEVLERQVHERYGVPAAELEAQRRTAQDATYEAEYQQRNDYQTALQWARENDKSLYNTHEMDMMGSDHYTSSQRHRAQLVETWRERTGNGPDKAQADAERAAARVDEATAAAVLAEPGEQAHASVDVPEQQAEVLYDSAERRQQLAAQLESAGVGEEAKEARLIADAAQAVPPNQAVARGRKSPKARVARTTGRQQDKSLSR